MQIQLNDIAGGEGVLGPIREEEFVDDPCTCDPNRALFLPGRMCGDNHAAGHAIRSHRDLWAIEETACCLAFGTVLHLIGGQVQPCLNQRMIEQTIVFASRHIRKASEIGEHRPIAILPVKPDQRAFW